MSSDEWPPPDPDVDPLPRRGLTLTTVFLAVVGLGLLAAWLLNSDDPAVATVGASAPAFEVKDVVAGESLTLEALIDEGRPIVINLMASWCGPCRVEIPEISAFADANPGVTVVGIAVDDVYADFAKFVSEVQLTYRVGFDEGEMRRAYQTLGLPATFFLNSDGTIADIFNGILNAEILEERASGLS